MPTLLRWTWALGKTLKGTVMFNHVQDDVLRWVLETGIHDEELLAYALRRTWDALDWDVEDEGVMDEWFSHKSLQLAEAEDQWAFDKWDMCVLHLRAFWG